MKKILVLFFALILLAVPVSAENYHIHDDEGLLKDHDVQRLETVYDEASGEYGFVPAIVTVESFGGMSAEEFAKKYYDIQGYPDDGIMLLISIKEGQWYILTNGECHVRISDSEAADLGEELLPLIRDGQYYAAFLAFPEAAGEIFEANEPVEDGFPDVAPAVPQKTFGKTFTICMGVGLLIGGIAVGIMAVQMKSVRANMAAADYIVPGSAHLTGSRDIYLYSRTTRTPKPKPNTSSGSGHFGGHSGGRSGGSRGGAGGRI